MGATASGSQQYLSFFIGDEEYGVSILEAREIIQYPAVTKVPAMPPAIRGVINLRGSVVPVIDLAVLFGAPARPITKWTCVIVVETLSGRSGAHLVGLAVDTVSQVIDLRPDDVAEAPAFGTRVDQRLLTGMGKSDKRFVLLLDLPRLLTDIEQHRAALETQAAAP